MQRTVLLVDDDADSRAIFRAILEHRGFGVIEAEDGESAIWMARSQLPSAILMDVSIPKLNGWDATLQLKADAATSGIPVIALTAHALERDREKAQEVGCDAYLTKPVEPSAVVTEVERLLDLAD